MKRIIYLLIAFFMTAGLANAQWADFENLSLNQESYWNGSDGAGGFSSGGAYFNNKYEVIEWEGETYISWYGFAYTNRTNTGITGLDSQYNAVTGGGINDSENYAVAYWSDYSGNPPTISLNEEQVITGAYFTNNNYAYYTMLNGDEDFGTRPFEEDDHFEIIVTGYDHNGQKTGEVEVYLARNGDILDKWEWVDLSDLGVVKTIEFTMESTDSTEEYMNTPAYFCMDDFNGTAPEADDGGGSGVSCFINAASAGFFSALQR